MVQTQAEQDAEHLRLLTVFHYVVAGMQALFATIPIFHFGFGVAMVFFPDTFDGGKGAPPQFVGWFFILFAAAWIVLGWSLAACLVIAGRSLKQRKRYLFCFVTAALTAALCMPFGTVLGIFTIIVLMRPSVKESFEGGAT